MSYKQKVMRNAKKAAAQGKAPINLRGAGFCEHGMREGTCGHCMERTFEEPYTIPIVIGKGPDKGKKIWWRRIRKVKYYPR